MPLKEMVIHSKLVAPGVHRGIFHRTRLQEKLNTAPEYPLTLIHAGTGYGKTTSLLELSGNFSRRFWYNITETDRDPLLFIAHLISAFYPEEDVLLDRLEHDGWIAAQSVLTTLINQLTYEFDQEAILVLDDYNLVADVQEITNLVEQFIENRPPALHFAISSRQVPETPAFVRWRVKGNVLTIDQKDLLLNEEEIFNLFNSYYQFPISTAQAHTLNAYTDGWIIALQMVWQRLMNSRSRQIERILAEAPTEMAEVFNYLGQEVLMRQPEGIQRFLIGSSTLRQMSEESCNAVLQISTSAQFLQQLLDHNLFISTTDDQNFRYQRLFHEFLQNQLQKEPETLLQFHRRAADYFFEHGNPEEAVYHLFACGDSAAAANIIEEIGQKMLQLGRLPTLSTWIETLDPQVLHQHPHLSLLMGDVLRLRSNFDEAVNWYGKAERIYFDQQDAVGRSRALCSQAQVYLDSVRPLRASNLLEEAISLLEPQEHPNEVADLLDQLAENKLNLGSPDEAQALHQEAHFLRTENDPNDIYLEARAFLRTGRLEEGKQVILSSHRLEDDSMLKRPPRFHREMPLLLSLIEAMIGNPAEAEKFAQQGIQTGRQLEAPFVEAVGYMRLGHAYQIRPQTPWQEKHNQRAVALYQRSIELVRPFNVMRVQVEPLWGLTRYYGYHDQLNETYPYARQAVEIAVQSGDIWFVGLIHTTHAISMGLAGEFDQSQATLIQARAEFQQVGDLFGESAVEMALVVDQWRQGAKKEALKDFAILATRMKTLKQDFLFLHNSFLAHPDRQIYFPILVEALRQGIEPEWITAVLRKQKIFTSDEHPGYRLAIRTLGPFEAYRGRELITPKDWQREKAKQLFQFLLSRRGKWFARESMATQLWPLLDSESNAQNFKVAMNALNRALEPVREQGAQPFFISRRDALYGINPAAEIVVDSDDFERLAGSNDPEKMADALEIYSGDYLNDNFDDPRILQERDRLRDLYLNTAERLAEIRFDGQNYDEVIQIGHAMLQVDACSEGAYRLLMRAHAAGGNRSIVHTIYKRLTNQLRKELDVSPSPESDALYKLLTK